MLDARRVIIAVVAIAAISLAVALIDLTAPPDSGGRGRDSYGTRGYGIRAVMELLEELDLDVQRSLVPPVAYLGDGTTIVLWAPEAHMVRMEPGHIARLADWVEKGGTVVVAPPIEDRFASRAMRRSNPIVTDTDVLGELGIRHIEVVNAGSAEDENEDEDEDDTFVRRGPFSSSTKTEYSQIAARYEGEWSYLGEVAGRLHVPYSDPMSIVAGGEDVSEPEDAPLVEETGRLTVTDRAGDEYVLAVAYRIGTGRVYVFADPRIFHNLSIAKADNAVLAAHVLSAGGRTVVFDEFYHGLTVRGNPIWLLSRHPYGLFSLVVVAATVLWAWRASSRLGPPIPDTKTRRRDIGEYIDAMALLFKRSGHRRFVLREVRDGVLWSLRKSLHLGPGREDVRVVATALERRDPERAGKLRAAEERVTALIKSNREPRADRAVRAAKEITECL